MAKLFLTCKLKPGVSAETFETWIRERDYPATLGFVAQDMPGGVVQGVMGEFMGLVDDPRFVVATEVV